MKLIKRFITWFLTFFFPTWLAKREMKKASKSLAATQKATGLSLKASGATNTELAAKLGLGPKRPKGEKVRSEKFRSRWFNLPHGASWNPLRKFPRNTACWCGAEKEVELPRTKEDVADGKPVKIGKIAVKAKDCCLPYLSSCVSRDTARYIKNNWTPLIEGRIKFQKAERPKEKAKPVKASTKAPVISKAELDKLFYGKNAALQTNTGTLFGIPDRKSVV